MLILNIHFNELTLPYVTVPLEIVSDSIINRINFHWSRRENLKFCLISFLWKIENTQEFFPTSFHSFSKEIEY